MVEVVIKRLSALSIDCKSLHPIFHYGVADSLVCCGPLIAGFWISRSISVDMPPFCAARGVDLWATAKVASEDLFFH